MHLYSNSLILIRLSSLNVMRVELDWVVFCYKKENLLHTLVRN